MATIGIIGCGAIGTLIAQAADKGIIKCSELVLFDINFEKPRKLQKSLSLPVKVVEDIDEMINLKPSVIIEAASQQAAKAYASKIVSEGIQLIVMSVGALLDLDLKSDKIHIPSGAVGGFDAISSAAIAGIEEASLTTRKSPKSLGISASEEKVVFEGSAEEAVRKFPKEVNVAATLALAVKPARVKVRVISDPKASRINHKIDIKWKHGNMILEFANDPHPDNLKTSALAAWSAIRLLKTLSEQ